MLRFLGGCGRNLVMNSFGSPFFGLFAVIRGLRGAVGGWSVRGWLGAALGLLLYQRLGRICRDMEGLASRFAAGRVRRVVGRVSVGRVAGGSAGRARVLPGDFGWLVKAASWHAAGYTSQLRAVLEAPEMVGFLEACPQAVRVLRPLCRMLAIEAAVLRPGLVDNVVSVDGVRPKRVRAPRAVVDMGQVPIPRGVMSAVRRGRYGVV